MKSLKIFSFIFIFTAFVFASNTKTESAKINVSSGSPISDKESISSEVLPIDVDHVTKIRTEKAVKDKKYSQRLLQESANSHDAEDEITSRSNAEISKKNMLKRWSKDLRDKLTVQAFKGKNGQKGIKIPSIPESN